MRRRRKTKILATLGPASNTRDKMRALFEAGADVFRINMSHTAHDMLARMVGDLRALSEEIGRPIGILCDLQGPKIRLGKLPGGPRMLVEGERIKLVLGETTDKPEEVPIPHPEIFQAIKQKHALLIDDGKVRLRLLKKADTYAEAIVEVAGEIKDRKGVNMPDTLLPMSAMTPKDHADLDAALALGVDWIALSFVQRPEDVAELKKIVRAARKAGKPVVVATQMMESMIHAPVPTRAEVSDVATAVFDGADAVMLSAESASGDFPVEAVQTMDRIAISAEDDELYHSYIDSQRGVPEKTIPDALMAAVHEITQTIEARAIVCWSTSGRTALRAARERPRAPIIAATPSLATARRMALVWGAHAIVTPDINSVDEMVSQASAIAVDEGFAVKGEAIVITAGIPFGKSGGTNMLRVATV